MPVQILRHTRRLSSAVAPNPQRPVRLVARDLDTAELLASHQHEWGQLTYALDGVIRTTAGNSTWIVPPMRAIWVPAGTEHEVAVLEKARLRALYIDANSTPFGDGDCRVIDVSALLRELILALSHADAGSRRENMLATLILDELSGSAGLPMRILLPVDKRLKILCETLIADPSSSLTLEDWAQQAGASARTLARLFERELDMSFGQWRQQVRLAHAAPLIARGMPISRVAAELGYASQSAFAAMFRKTFGKSPTAFFQLGRTGPEDKSASEHA